MATIEVAHELGLAVPRDLSVIGFDDIPESAQVDPPLTTVHQPIQQLGAAAIGMLTALLDGGDTSDPHVRLPTSLVRRATTAAL